MKLLVKIKGEKHEGLIVGYGPGRKGKPVAIVAVDGKLRPVKLRSLELTDWAKLREVPSAFALVDPETLSDAIH